MKIFLIFVLISTTLICRALGNTFMVVKGDVKIVSGGSLPMSVKVGTQINVGDTVVTSSVSHTKIVMFDRNIIYVSPNTNTKIETYPQT